MKKLMEKRINISNGILILYLSLTLVLTTGVQVRGNPDDQVDPILNTPEKLETRQIGPDMGGQKIIKRLRFNDKQSKTVPYFLEGKRCFKEGVRLNNQNDFYEAAAKFEEALNHLEKSGHSQSIALTHLNLAICLQTLQENQKSLHHYQAASDISRKNGFLKYEAKALQGIGLIMNSMKRKDEAVSCLDRAIEIHRKVFNLSEEANDWLIKGIIERTRDANRARVYFECAQWISQELGDPALKRKTNDYLNQLREGLYKQQTPGDSLYPL